MNELVQAHVKNGFYIDITKTKNGCRIKTPANIFLDPQHLAETTEYKIENGILYINDDDYLVPQYSIRSLILIDIMMKAQKLAIPFSLILYFDTLEAKQNITEILDEPKDILEKQKDNLLLMSLSGIILGEFDSEDAKKYNILEGFYLIYSICQKGGI